MFEEFLQNKESWLNGKGPDSDIVFSSRIRVARNAKGYLFPLRATAVQREEVYEKIKAAIPGVKQLKDSMAVSMNGLDDVDKMFLLERHLVSQEHLSSQRGKGVVITSDEHVAVMINEEDHLRMQVITSGFDLGKCWDILNSIDNDLSKKISFSFDSEIGYLTACPTNVGTGLRASCMLHLPALVLTKRINKILELLAKISFTARGLFGEGTQALGNFFQVSNQVSLGVSEQELIDNLVGVVNQVKQQELDARQLLLKKYRMSLEDSIGRAYGILRNCRMIDTKEAFSHLSVLSLGLDLGIIKKIKRETLNNLFIIIQPAHLQKIEGRPLKEGERDYIRAQVVRDKLS